MAGMVDQLIEVLEEQATRYDELLGLSKEKRDTIIVNDVEPAQNKPLGKPGDQPNPEA